MRMISLGEIAEYINGRAFRPEEWETKGLPIIRIQNLTGSSQLINYYNGEFDKKHLVKKGDILISWSASLGVYMWGGNNAVLNQHIFKVILKDSVDKLYFYYAASNALNEMISKVHGATMQHITKEPFEATLIPLPPFPEQKRIATILEKADRLRRQRRYALELSNTYLQSVFLEMFGDPATNPNGWEEEQLENILEHKPQNGLYVPRESYVNDASQSGTEMVHMSDLFYGIVQRGNLKRVNISPEDVRRYSLTSDDVLIARRSLTYEGAAKPCRIPGSKEPLVFESSMIKITPNKARLSALYLYYYLSNEESRKAHILKYVTQSTISGINQTGLKSIRIMLPPLKVQEKFAQIAQKFERFRAQQREAERQAEHLFQTLLHQAFEGNVGLGVGIGRDGDVEDGVQSSVGGSDLTGDYVQLQMKY